MYELWNWAGWNHYVYHAWTFVHISILLCSWRTDASFKNVWRFSSRSTSLYFSTRFLVRFKPDFA